jgi:hypothetical protein
MIFSSKFACQTRRDSSNLPLALPQQNAAIAIRAAATVTAARSVADCGIDVDDPAAAARSDDAASIMLEKGKGNKNGLEDIGIQA